MRNQRGFALLVAIIVAILLSLLGLSLTFMSLKEAGTAVEFENHEKALMVADGGLQRVKRTLRSYDLTEMLNVSVGVPYASGGRMPILPVDARNTDFEHGPGTGASTVLGMLTPPDGELITMGDVRGRFFAKVSDNRDETARKKYGPTRTKTPLTSSAPTSSPTLSGWSPRWPISSTPPTPTSPVAPSSGQQSTARSRSLKAISSWPVVAQAPAF